MDKFRDVAYSFEYDNPFENDSQRILCNHLITLIGQNASIFRLDDYINKVLYSAVNTKLKGLYGRRIDGNILTNPIANDVKDFLKDFKDDLPDDLKKWIGEKVEVAPVEEEEEDNGEENAEETPENDAQTNAQGTAQTASEGNDIVKLDKNKYAYSMTDGITNYDISSEKLLGLVQVRELSINIARSLLVKNIQVDVEVQKLETKRRKELIVQIQKYKNIKKIAALLDDDIIDMSIDQLEICLEQCKKYHETFKLQEVIKSSFNGGKLIMNALLPNGIKVGKKRIKFEGIADELVGTLFDSTSVIGKSFDNLAQKYNFHINDDALVLLKIGETIVKGIKIENVDDEPKEDPLKQPSKLFNRKSSMTTPKREDLGKISRIPARVEFEEQREDSYSSDSDDSENDDSEESEDEYEDDN